MRAFEPLQVSLQRHGSWFAAWVVNDFPTGREVWLEIGFIDLVTSRLFTERQDVRVAANAAECVWHLDAPAEVRAAPERFLAVARLSTDEGVLSRARATLVGFEFRRLWLPEPQLDVRYLDQAIQLHARTYVFQAHVVAEDGVAADNWFDLLPGEVRTIAVPGDGAEATVWCFANAREDPRRRRLGVGAVAPGDSEEARVKVA
jgi:mannosidase-like protein/Ig-like domain-containing protein